MKWIALLFVFSGAGLLAFSLLPTRNIIRGQQPQDRGWKILFSLIVFFLLGYISYAVLLVSRPLISADFIVALILFGGSWFVILVTRLSLLSIQQIRRIAALERHHALHDDLTDLPNRSLFYERLAHTIARAKRNRQQFSILVMDLDQFKEVNDTLGHLCGDRLLQQVAPCLRDAIRDSDMVARLGGDEFAVLLPDTGIEGACQLSQKMLDAMQTPFIVEGHHLKIGISIGIAVYPDHGTDSETLLQRADVAMYIAKRNNLGYSTYNAREDQYTVNRLTLISKLHEALQQEQLQLYYQPIINIHNNEIWGVEALTHWPHPEHGYIPPADFIPLAEQSGSIRQLTRWLLSSVTSQILAWQKSGYRLRVSTNLSVKDIQDNQFAEQVQQLLEQSQVDPRLLTMEITESSMMTDPKRAQATIAKLHHAGISIAIDDFGTGYSSLSYLKQLPAQHIKIDKSFILDMLEDDNDAIIVRSTIDLAHNMGRKVIAEGVDQQDILDLLEILRCNYAQGFYICPPLPAEALIDWLNDSANRWYLKTA